MICQPVRSPESTYEELRIQKHLLPVKLTAHYESILDQEKSALGTLSGPLYRAMMPTMEKMTLVGPGEHPDFVSDRSQMPKGSSGCFLHKYADRVLFLPTHRCLAHCMYCFRQDLLEQEKSKEEQILQKNIQELENYLLAHPEVHEVILSGGDPLMLSPKALDEIFSRYTRIPHISRFRIHTRAPIFDPRALTENHLKVLIQHKVRIILHCIHPYELVPELCEKLMAAQRQGAKLYNHFPLLRGVNDHPLVLFKLLEQCDQIGVRPLSVYFPEPVLHSAVYRIAFKRIQKIVSELQQNSPSWIHGLRFCQDTPYGKLQLHEVVKLDAEKCLVIYQRKQQLIEVPDFPEHLDRPGELENLLWKN
jgi:KamA family protein